MMLLNHSNTNNIYEFNFCNKYKNNIIISTYVCNFNNSFYKISQNSYIIPNLIYIYNYLEKKLSSDILCIIINNYISLFNKPNIKCSINNYLKYYIHSSNIIKDSNNKFVLKGINTNTNSIAKTFSIYNFEIKCYLESLFIKYVNIIIEQYINN